VIQVEPPPSFQVSPFQVSPPVRPDSGSCGSPQMLAGRGVQPSMKRGCRTPLPKCGQHDAVGDQRRHGHRVAFLDVGGF